MGTVGSEGMGAVCKILGPGGPHQSIRDGKTDCVPDLMERSSMTPESMCNRPKLEGAKPESNGAMEFTNKELPVAKGGALLKLLQDLEIE